MKVQHKQIAAAGWMLWLLPMLSFTEPVRSAAEPDYPPLSFVNPDGQADGFSVELLRAVLSEMGRDVAFETGLWADIKTGLAEGQLDVLPLVGRTPEREKLFDFSVQYLTLHGALFIRDDNTQIQGLGDLPEKRIAVMQGDNAEEYVRRAALSDQILTTPTFEEAFRMLSDGRADAVIAQKLMGVSLLKELGLSRIRVVGKPSEEFKQEFCFAVKKGNAELLSVLNEGLALVRAEEIFRRLETQWMGRCERDAARARVVVYGGTASFPPYEFIDAKGRPSGFNIELARAVAREAGFDIAFQLEPWETVRRKIENGDIDMTSMNYSPERAKLVDFSIHHSIANQAVFGRTDSPDYESFADLKGRRVSVANKSIMHDYALQQGLGQELRLTTSSEDALAMLADGRADFSLTARRPGLFWSQSHKMKHLKVIDTPLPETDNCFAVTKGNTALLNLIHDALVQLKESGEYREIYNRWLKVLEPDFSWNQILKWVLAVLAAIASLAAVSGAIIRSLKRQVDKRTAQLKKSNRKLQESRRAALNMMNDAVAAKEQMEALQGDLKESEQRFRLAVGTIQDVFWMSKKDLSEMIYVSPAYEQIWGRPLTDVLQRPEAFMEPIIPADQARYNSAIQKFHLQGRAYSVEYQIQRPDGDVRWILERGFPIANDRGESELMTGVCSDITVRKRAEDALRNSENLFRQLFQSHSITKLVLDADSGQIVDANPASAGFYGWPREKLITMNISEINPLPPEQIKKNLMKAVANQNDYFEVQHRRADGAIRDVAVFSGIVNTDGKKLIIQIIYNLTEKKRAEAELNTARQINEGILNAIPVRVFWKDQNLTFLGCNTAFANDAGYSDPQEVIGKDDTRMVWKDQADQYLANDRRVIESGQPLLTREESHTTPEGKLATVLTSKMPLRNPQGEIVGVLGAYIDISEKIQLEAQLRRTQKLEAVGQLAGGIAHDFNNILQGIVLFSELLLGKLEAKSREYGHALEIKKAVTQAAGLTRQLLAFSREQPVNCEPLNLNRVIENTQGMLGALLSRKTRLVLNPEPHLNRIYADKGQLSQILMNLAVNARDAMPEGGQLIISTENVQFSPSDVAAIPDSSPGEFIRLSVADTGCGMSPHVKEHLFEPFFTTKDEHKGTGLGLSVVYGLVIEHGGWIHVDSTEGQGTVFKLYFPVSRQPALPAEPADAPAPAHKEHALLVEDNSNVRQLVIHLLQSADYQVSAAANAKEALELFNADPQAFSLLVSDIALPSRSGIELANELRKTNPSLPVILCSGDQSQRARRNTSDCKNFAFLQKPFTITSLLLAIHETVHSHTETNGNSDHIKQPNRTVSCLIDG